MYIIIYILYLILDHWEDFWFEKWSFIPQIAIPHKYDIPRLRESLSELFRL